MILSCTDAHSLAGAPVAAQGHPDVWGCLAFWAHLCIVGPPPSASTHGDSCLAKSFVFVCSFVCFRWKVLLEAKISAPGFHFSWVNKRQTCYHSEFTMIASQFNLIIIRSIKFFKSGIENTWISTFLHSIYLNLLNLWPEINVHPPFFILVCFHWFSPSDFVAGFWTGSLWKEQRYQRTW